MRLSGWMTKASFFFLLLARYSGNKIPALFCAWAKLCSCVGL